jgi:hypothetical protein
MDPNDWTLTGNAGTNPSSNYLGTADNQPLAISTNASEKMRITPNGFVGIGTKTPLSTLNLNSGDTANADIFMIGNNSSRGLLLRDVGHALDIFSIGYPLYINNVNQNTYINAENGGNVGIGTTTPIAKLTVQGDVSVSGDVILTGADCAEEFDIVAPAEAEPGTVVVVDQGGILHQCQQAYDKRVAGVISGAGDFRPSLILDRQQSQENRMPVALVGKVYCKVDARYAPIEAGDLLTTSPTPGHAMKADDPLKAFGAVIGKALRALQAGQGMIPILIALQ